MMFAKRGSRFELSLLAATKVTPLDSPQCIKSFFCTKYSDTNTDNQIRDIQNSAKDSADFVSIFIYCSNTVGIATESTTERSK